MPLTADDLLSLEAYARERPALRAQVIAHKKVRRLFLGCHLTLLFEDASTIRHQIHEMLRAERIFERAAIDDELAAYNPLIPDGRNWKATMLIEFPDPAERACMLARLIGVAWRVWMQVEGLPRIHAIADADAGRERGNKTSAVQFLRFELDEAAIRALKAGAGLSAGVDHPACAVPGTAVAAPIRATLIADLS